MEVIDQIRQAANIVELASQYTTLKKAGRRHVGLCPFHTEKTPSFTLDDEKQLFHCFGCGTGGDVFTLVMEKENLSFPEAVRYLAEKYNIPLPEQRKFTVQNKELGEELKNITEQALAHFRKNLHNTNEGKEALSYLKKRKISDETIQKLKIGYALNSWDYLISYFKRKEISPKKLENAGLAIYHQKKNSYYDRFRGRIIFPIFKENGRVVAFGGRSLFNDEPKYLNSPDTPIYKKGNYLYGLNFSRESIKEKGEVILVEGYTDFIALFQAGITNVVASLGTSLTSNQLGSAFRFAPEKTRLFVCFDGDIAGAKATFKAVSLGIQKEIPTKVIKMPSKLDPDNIIEKYGIKLFQNLMEKGIKDLVFLKDYFSQGLNPNTAEDKTKVAMKMVNILKSVPNPIAQSEKIKETSELLNINENELRSMLGREVVLAENKEKIYFLPAEKILLEILFEKKELAKRVIDNIKEDLLVGLKGESIFNELKSIYKKNKEIPNLNEFKEKINTSLFSALARIQFEKKKDINYTYKDVQECFEALKKRYLDIRYKELDNEIKKLQRQGNLEESLVLLGQINDIKKQQSLLSQQSQ